MGYPIPESDIAGKVTMMWEDEPGCSTCGHDLVWANAEGQCTYVENDVRCGCVQHK